MNAYSLTDTWFVSRLGTLALLGSLGPPYLGIALFLLSAIGMGLLVSSLAVTMQQRLLGSFLFPVPAILLSGFTTPIENMPSVVQNLTLLNPMRCFLVVLRGIFLEGASATLLWSQFWPMAVIALVGMAVAGILFRRRLYRRQTAVARAGFSVPPGRRGG